MNFILQVMSVQGLETRLHLPCIHVLNKIYMWLSQVEIEHYFVAYLKCVIMFETL